MNHYLKHTEGESFTLDSQDYSGFFRMVDGVAFSGKVDGDVLSPKNTYMSKLYTDIYNLDTNYKNIDNLVNVYTNTLDVLDKLGIDRILNILNVNNMTCYKSLVLSNPLVMKYEETDGFFYGLSSVSEDSDKIYPKRGLVNIEPFSNSQYWGFLDNITVGQHMVDTFENFKYICSDGFTTYTLSGNFSGSIPLTKISEYENTPYYDKIWNIHHDLIDGKMFFVKNDYIEVYDASNYELCDNLILIDRIELNPTSTLEHIWNTLDVNWNDFNHIYNEKFFTTNDNNPEFIKIGKNIRTGFNTEINVLSLYNKYSKDIYSQIDLSQYNISKIIDIDIHDCSDNVILLYTESNGQLRFLFIDIEQTTNFESFKIQSISGSPDSYKLKFSEFDSNVFYISNSEEFQTRNVSNPEYPSGRLELNDLGYPKSYIWNEIDEIWNFLSVKWDVNGSAANKYHNLASSVCVHNNRMYMILNNLGKLYVLNQEMSDRFHTSIPLNLESSYFGANCSESSIGIYLNTNISNILKDTLNILASSRGSFDIYEYEVLSKEIDDHLLNSNNLFLNGNENVNIVTLQRILLTILDIQSKILPSSIEN